VPPPRTRAGGPREGSPIEWKAITVNAPFQASVTIAPLNPSAGDAVRFASTSRDPHGPLVGFAWDTDNDGAFDDAVGPVVSKLFTAAGAHPVRLRVVDARGAAAVSLGRVVVRARPTPRCVPAVDVDIGGSVTNRGTRIRHLSISSGHRLRVRALERRLRPRAKLSIAVRMPGFVGSYTVVAIRRGLKPKRTEPCLPPGVRQPRPCPRS
jgi:hypothetical protein